MEEGVTKAGNKKAKYLSDCLEENSFSSHSILHFFFTRAVQIFSTSGKNLHAWTSCIICWRACAGSGATMGCSGIAAGACAVVSPQTWAAPSS